MCELRVPTATEALRSFVSLIHIDTPSTGPFAGKLTLSFIPNSMTGIKHSMAVSNNAHDEAFLCMIRDALAQARFVLRRFCGEPRVPIATEALRSLVNLIQIDPPSPTGPLAGKSTLSYVLNTQTGTKYAIAVSNGPRDEAFLCAIRDALAQARLALGTD